jgi:hypothetical protein
MTDVARLYMMKELFLEGAERVVWVDADVLVFDPENLMLDIDDSFFGIEEISVFAYPDGSTKVSPVGLNGAILGARRDSALFSLYLDAVESRVRDYPEEVLPRTIAGPLLLTELAKTNFIKGLTTVGLFTPNILYDIAHRQSYLPALFAKSFGHKVAAANLCHFFRDLLPDAGAEEYDEIMRKAIEQLILTKGEVVNCHISG